jgi:hypothetical protein
VQTRLRVLEVDQPQAIGIARLELAAVTGERLPADSEPFGDQRRRHRFLPEPARPGGAVVPELLLFTAPALASVFGEITVDGAGGGVQDCA